MYCGRNRRGVWDRDAVRRLSRDDSIDYGLGRSFGPLTGPEIRQSDPARLQQILLRRPPPFIALGEVKSQAGMNQGLHQLLEGLNDIARRTPMNQNIQYPRVGLAWYLPNNLVRYMVAQPNADPRLSRRIWQGNIGTIGPLPHWITNMPMRTRQQRAARVTAAGEWREQQVRNLVQHISGQAFRALPPRHEGPDLQPSSGSIGILGRNPVLSADDFDALDEAMEEAVEDVFG